MATIRKFAFETEFAPDGAVLREAAKKFTAEEVAAECAQAYQSGTQDSLARSERDAAAALQMLADAASALLSRLDAESRAMRGEAARLALTAARKIADAALDAYGGERAAAAVEAAMDMLRHQPRLVVKLSPEAAEKLGPRIAAMSEAHAYAGAVLVRAQPDLAAGEVAIDWSDGVITLNNQDAAQRIDALIEAALAAPDEQGLHGS